MQCRRRSKLNQKKKSQQEKEWRRTAVSAIPEMLWMAAMSLSSEQQRLHLRHCHLQSMQACAPIYASFGGEKISPCLRLLLRTASHLTILFAAQKELFLLHFETWIWCIFKVSLKLASPCIRIESAHFIWYSNEGYIILITIFLMKNAVNAAAGPRWLNFHPKTSF